MNALAQQLKNYGFARFAAVFGLAAGLALALAFFGMNLGGGQNALLYSGLSAADASAAVERLDQANIPYELRDGGSAIYVPRTRVDEARVRVARDGAIGFGSVGYEIFDRSDSLGATSFVQNMNAKRALEGELARTIQSLEAVQSARVHLVLPERRLFERERQQPSASVIVASRGPLNAEQINVIRNLVASSVNGLAPTAVTLADQTGRLLAGASDETAAAAVFDERRQAFEERLRQRIMDIVEGVAGPGAVRVQVSADLDRQSITESSEIYDPDGRVIRSRETSEDMSREQDRSRTGRVSASENLPGQEAEAANGAPANESSRRNDTVNYEISRTTRTQVREAGAVQRLSVAVAVDGLLEPGADGALAWSPRPAEEMQRIEALVRSAMGFNAERGDSVEVSNVRFSRLDPMLGETAPSGFSFNRDDIMRAAEIAVMFVTAILVIFLVARPLARGAAAPAPAAAAAGGGAVSGPARAEALPGQESAGALPAPEDDGRRIDIAKIDGQVKASSVKKVAGVVGQHPDESMSILRTWMHEA